MKRASAKCLSLPLQITKIAVTNKKERFVGLALGRQGYYCVSDSF